MTTVHDAPGRGPGTVTDGAGTDTPCAGPVASADGTTREPGLLPGRRRRSERARTVAWIVGGALALVATVVVAVTIGPAEIRAGDVWRSVAHHLGMGRLLGLDTVPLLQDGMVWQLRLPRVLTAAAVGAGLAVCGVVMQSVTRNPLADPYLLGLSSGASLGAVCVIVLGSAVLLPVAAFVGAVAALAGALLLASSAGSITPTRTILAGLAVGQLCAAGTSFIIFWSATGDSYREILAWLMGSVAGSTWASVAIAGGALLVLGTLLTATGSVLDAFTFGDTAASALGISVNRTRWALLVAVALLTGALVSVSGSIGFVGLILPHLVRLVAGARHRLLLPVSGLFGATFLVWADTAARTVFAPRELPVGIVTAAVGAPVFALVLWRGRRST
ncbi:putative F420-0 ABC transporter permease subunit [Sanguibacter antarcticus]|uniref:Iron complex transport system permease protein n=1 Tax=Sanguibacter antarcticus TaxID=372484 RepID=A0A2A9E5Y1_9MICO|nr:putative F420-0 ABC transporter permease subunit [Sanguibacter antarcticus]PFG33580.1 iron complex transport system permease protein [Sanguibacter antarcticus]